jgi:hypothetical protein
MTSKSAPLAFDEMRAAHIAIPRPPYVNGAAKKA